MRELEAYTRLELSTGQKQKYDDSRNEGLRFGILTTPKAVNLASPTAD